MKPFIVLMVSVFGMLVMKTEALDSQNVMKRKLWRDIDDILYQLKEDGEQGMMNEDLSKKIHVPPPPPPKETSKYQNPDKKTSFTEKDSTEYDLDMKQRNAIQLASMVHHTTGTNPAKYLTYGCYCGFGGKGEPVDELDRCCLTHDRCYGNLTADYGCSEWWRYLNTYDWKVGSSGDIVCLPEGSNCKDGQCVCDKQMAECFQQNHAVYNDDYTGWWWALFKEC